MSRHSKSKKRRKQSLQSPLLDSLTDPSPDDPIWLYQKGNILDKNAETICQGTLDLCLKALVADDPSLSGESDCIGAECAGFGFVDGGDWCIVTTTIRYFGFEETAIRVRDSLSEY
jgi:hypothetical protein